MSAVGNILSAAIVASGIAAGGYLAGQGLVQSRLGDRSVTVKGLAERTVKADLGFWPLRFTAAGNELEIARQDIERFEAAAIAFLKAQGFAEDSISVQSIRVEDRATGYNSGNVGENRYVLTEDILVRSGDVDRLAQAARNVGDLVRAGVVLSTDAYASGPSYVFTGLNELKPEMLTEATKRAREAADQFAQESGAKVGAIQTANQGLFSIDPAIEIPNEGGDKQIEKKVRVVSTVTYFLE